jgi:protein involved in polysaccharide export with SLBB domain
MTSLPLIKPVEAASARVGRLPCPSWQWLLACLLGLLLPNLACAADAPTNSSRTNLPAGTPLPLALGATSMATLDDSHKLAIGDLLSFRIEEDQDDQPKSLMLTDSGDVDVPYIGRLPAEGKTCKQLAFEIKRALEKDYYYQATVVLAVDQRAKSRGKVYLVGPVHNPGPQDIPSDEILTLSKAILRAGGFTELAERHNVRIIRRTAAADKQVLVVDVAQIFDKGKVELDPPLQPGDLVVVPERLVRF